MLADHIETLTESKIFVNFQFEVWNTRRQGNKYVANVAVCADEQEGMESGEEAEESREEAEEAEESREGMTVGLVKTPAEIVRNALEQCRATSSCF